MKENARIRYVRAMGLGVTPDLVPRHIIRYYDELSVYLRKFIAQQDPDYAMDPLIAFLAEREEALEKRIAALEERLGERRSASAGRRIPETATHGG